MQTDDGKWEKLALIFMQKEQLEQKLQIKLTGKEQISFLEQTQEVWLKKGDIPVRENDICEFFYYIIAGLVRGFYIDENGTDVTKCFSKETQFFSTECYRTKQRSSFYIECMEDCHCIKIPYAFLNENSAFSETILKLYVTEVQRLEKRVRAMLLLNATQRYEQFCMEYEDLRDRIPLKCIASFIGILPESLSRIRHEQRNLT